MSRLSFKCIIPILIGLLLSSSAALAGAMLKPAGGKSMQIYCKSASADVRIQNQFAKTTLTLVYQHNSSSDTEAEFSYELPDGAVATHFAYWAKDEKVVARIVEKQRAAEIYRKITERRRDPALVEMIGKNKFRVRISPVFAFEDLKIELVYVQTLPSVAGDLAYTLQLANLCEKDDDLEEINVRIRATADQNLVAVTNNYGLPVEKSGSGYSLSLKGCNYNPPKDLSVRFKRRSSPLLASVYSAPSSRAGDGFFALALTPDHSLNSPRVSITGVSTYDTVQSTSKVKAGESVLICGRYKGSGIATVTLRGKSSSGPTSYSAKVRFSGDVEAANLASKLWASGMIEKLSKKKSNRDSVVNMSLRFTLPSRYTSWLAVPKAEMIEFLRQKYSQELDAAAVKWAKAIADGEEQTAAGKKAKQQYDACCAKIGLVPEDEISNHLWDAMAGVAGELATLCADGKMDTAEFRARKACFNRLVAMYPSDSDPVGIYNFIGSDSEPVKRLVKMIANGKGESDEAKALKTRLAKLVGDRFDVELHSAIYSRVYTVYRELLDAQWGIKPNMKKAAKLRSELNALDPDYLSQRLNSDKYYTIGGTLSMLTDKIVDAAAQSPNSPSHKALLARYQELLGAVEEEKREGASDIESAAADGMRRLAGQLTKERDSKSPNNAIIKQIKTKMANLEKAYKVSSREAVESVKTSLAEDYIYSYMRLLQEGKQNSREAAVFKKRGQLYGKLSQTAFSERISQIAGDSLESLASQYSYDKYCRWGDPKSTEKTMETIRRLERISGKSASKYLEKYASEWRVWTAGDQVDLLYDSFYAELHKNKPNNEKLQNLKNQIGLIIKQSNYADRSYASDSLLEEGMGIARLQMEIRSDIARGDIAKAKESRKKRAEMLERFYWSRYGDVFRYGDPLISVEAPADSAQVIAVMPDGEIKVLVYNAASNRWEGRFDVPSYVAEGSYSYSVIVVSKSGSRSVIAVKYGVDMTAPQAAGSITSNASHALLQINADDDTARAVALLPWGERIELKNGDQPGTYCGQVEVPVEYQGEAYSTTFVLTDSAHNRTTVTVDSAK